MAAYKLVDGSFAEVADPADEFGSGDYAAGLAEAGYRCEVSSRFDEYTVGAEVTVYVREQAPRYYLDLMGGHSQIAVVIADDFPEFIKALKELDPLIHLIRLDQASSIRVIEELEGEEREKGLARRQVVRNSKV